MSPAAACCLRNNNRRPTRSTSPAIWRPFSVCRGRRQRNFFSQGLGQLRTADAHALARFDLGAKAGDRPVAGFGGTTPKTPLNGWRRPVYAALTQCSVVGFYKKGNRARSRGLNGGGRSPAKPVSVRRNPWHQAFLQGIHQKTVFCLV